MIKSHPENDPNTSRNEEETQRIRPIETNDMKEIECEGIKTRMPSIILFNITPIHGSRVTPQLFRSTPQRRKERKKEKKRKERTKENTQKEHHMADQQGKNDSEDDNQIAIDQLGLMQTMIPEETPPHTPVSR